MTTALAPPPRADTTPGVYRFRVDQYLRLVRLGILDRADRVELLDGIVVAKMSKNPPHVLAVKRLVRALAVLLPAGWHVAKEDPIQTPSSVPEPDAAVLRGGPEAYADRLPTAGDLALVVEVADATLARDRDAKRLIYAEAGIAAYWLVDLANRRLRHHSDPGATALGIDYRAIEEFGADDEVPLILDGREAGRVAVAEILP